MTLKHDLDVTEEKYNQFLKDNKEVFFKKAN